jgi:hypothetical protein
MKMILISFCFLISVSNSLNLRSRYGVRDEIRNSLEPGSAARRLTEAGETGRPEPRLDMKIARHGSEQQIKNLVDRILSSSHSDEKKDRMLSVINDHIRRRIVSESMAFRASKPRKDPLPERKLEVDQNFSSSGIQSGMDETGTSARLANIQSQEKAMNNYKKVHTMMDEVDEKLEDLRNNISREFLNMANGMQRRSMLMGHYNFIGAGLGAPAGGNMSMMDPYFHF